MKALILLSIFALPVAGDFSGAYILTTAFQEKNATLLEAYMSQQVTVQFFESEMVASPKVAAKTIQRLIDANKGCQFKFRHECTSKGGKSGMWVGDLKTKHGVLRVVASFKKTASSASIDRITLDSPGMSQEVVDRFAKKFHFSSSNH